jgi:hypothetical protein
MVVLVFVRVRSGASAQLSGALSGDQHTSSTDYNVNSMSSTGSPMVAAWSRFRPRWLSIDRKQRR